MDILNMSAKSVTLLVCLLCVLIGILSYLFYKKYNELQDISEKKDNAIQVLLEQRELFKNMLNEKREQDEQEVCEDGQCTMHLLPKTLSPIQEEETEMLDMDNEMAAELEKEMEMCETITDQDLKLAFSEKEIDDFVEEEECKSKNNLIQTLFLKEDLVEEEEPVSFLNKDLYSDDEDFEEEKKRVEMELKELTPKKEKKQRKKKVKTEKSE